MKIHRTALVSPKAELGENVEVGPFAVIEDDATIGDDCEIGAGAYIASGARIGARTRIFSGAVIATEPQDLKYGGEKTIAEIGEDTVIREYATINRGTAASGKTVVGDNCLIMAYSHIAHDCVVGNETIIANATQLGGHVEIEERVVVGGVVKIHQFCRIGAYSMLGADARIVKDVPPYSLIGSEPTGISGVNVVGLKRRGFSLETINVLREFYRFAFFSDFNVSEGIEEFLKRREHIPETKRCAEFIQASQRGIHGARSRRQSF